MFSYPPTHRWEMTHTYFSSVSARSDWNLSWLHAEAKSALFHLCSVHLSRLPLYKPVLHYYSQQGERCWESRRIDLPCRKHLWKQFPCFFLRVSVCLQVEINCSIYTNEVSETLEDECVSELTKLETTNFAKFFWNCLIKVDLFSNNNKKGTLLTQQQVC